jgi:hypothetical protein
MKYKVLFLSLMLVPALSSATGILLDSAIAVDTVEETTFSLRPVGLAFDGTYYWAGKAGNTSSPTLAQYDASGTRIATYDSDIDFRSLFASASGMYATDYGSDGIQVYSFSGANPSLMYTLDTTPNVQMEMGLRSSTNTLYGHSNGTIYGYDFSNGQQISSFTLTGFSALYPQNIQIAVLENHLLTYNDDGKVGVWDYSGNLLGESLIGLTSFDQMFSFSYTNGLVWIETSRSAGFTGYDIGLSTAAVPLPAAAWLFASGLMALGWLRPKVVA